jgi:site-specific DNA recombinase
MVRRDSHPDNPLPNREALLYARVSSKEQEKEGFSIPSQLKVLRSYAAAAGLKVAREFVDVETAKESGRAGFNEMVAFVKKSPSCRVVLVEKTDRLYRNLKDWVTLDELDLEIHFAKENVVLSRDSRSSEKFMHGIKVLMAKNYIDNLSEETRKGMHEKAEQGLWPSCAPLGYRNVQGLNGKKTIEPDPTVAPMVARLFELYSTGTYSLKEVTRLARNEGMVFRKSKSSIPRATVHKILRNLIYTGEFEWNGVIHQGSHTPLVSRDLWDRVQTTLNHRLAKRHRKVKHAFAFSGLLYCGHCGCALVGEIKKAKYVYYHCTGYRGNCSEPYTREEVFEKLFGDLLGELRMDSEVIEWVREALRQSQQDERRCLREAVERLQAQYDTLQSRIEAMYLDRLDGRIDTTFFDRKASEWRSEQDRLSREIQNHRGSDQTYLSEGVRLLELAGKTQELFLIQPPREKRRLLNFLLSNCTWKGGALDATFRQPFDMLRDTIQAHRSRCLDASVPKPTFENWLPGLDSN